MRRGLHSNRHFFSFKLPLSPVLASSPGKTMTTSTAPTAAMAAREARDEALWLSKPTNSRLIQPPAPSAFHDAGEGPSSTSPPPTLEEYVRRRQWAGKSTETLLASPGLRVLSHLLSYPLTLAHYLPSLYGSDTASAKVGSPGGVSHVAIIGARAEATLPDAWWQEVLCMQPGLFCLHMVGPEVYDPATRAGRESVRLDPQRQLWMHRRQGLYHVLAPDLVSSFRLSPSPSPPALSASSPGVAATPAPTASSLDPEAPSQAPDASPAALSAAVLFNPGLGHPALAEAWKPTLQCLQAAKVPVLWTAHSAEDRDRDVACLSGGAEDNESGCGDMRVEWLVAPGPNPFASRKLVVDPLNAQHVLAANKFAGIFRWR